MYLYIVVLFLVSIRGVLGLPTPPQAQSPLTPQPQWPLGTILWVKPIHLDESSRFGIVRLCYHVRRVQCFIYLQSKQPHPMIVVPVPNPRLEHYMYEYFVTLVTNSPPIALSSPRLPENFLPISQMRVTAPSIFQLKGFVYVRRWCKKQQGFLSSVVPDDQHRSVNLKDIQYIHEEIRKSSIAPSSFIDTDLKI